MVSPKPKFGQAPGPKAQAVDPRGQEEGVVQRVFWKHGPPKVARLYWGGLGTLEFKGGFDTPEEVVQAFGGRATGYVEGLVFHDQNRDGVRNPDEPPLPGAKVRVGAWKR